MRALAVVAAALVACGAAHALDTARYRYERTLETRGGLTAFEPDGPMYQHAAVGFPDLRVVDARGRQVPWRFYDVRDEVGLQAARVLNAGTEDGAAVALLDFGLPRVVRGRIQLDVPLRPFVGRAEIFGSDDRKAFTRLSSTAIYDVRGARRAVSTAVVFPPSDFRYYRIRASGVARIRGATAQAVQERARPVERSATITVRQRGKATVVDADVHYRRVPVSEIRFVSATPSFDRPVEISGSNDRRFFFVVGGGRLYRFGGTGQTIVPVDSRFRYLRIRIENGDDEPLRELRVTLRADRDYILLAPGFTSPYRVLYGGPPIRPEYDFAQQPAPRAEPEYVALGAEHRNAEAGEPEDTRSFFERNDWLVQAALGLAAIVLGTVAFVVFRRKAA